MTKILSLIFVMFLSFQLTRTENVNKNNWAILIDTSAYWFNYRHASNTLSLYQSIKSRGIPDSQIILMIAEDIACNSRNVFPGIVVNNELKRENLVNGEIEIDYRGAEVSVNNLIRLLTNRHSDSTVKNKLLLTDENSNILIFLTGHGGENFLKFRNVEEVSAHDLAGAFEQMWQQRRYREILFIIDTCQASSMFSEFKSPNIFAIASSKVGESSYSYTVDSEIGLSVIDRFSHKLIEFLKYSTSESTLNEFIEIINSNLDFLGSTPVFRSDLFPRSADLIKIFDFFANTPRVIEQDVLRFKSKNSSVVHHLDLDQEKYLGFIDDNVNVNNNFNNRRVYKISFNTESNTSSRLSIIIYTLMFIVSFYYLFKPHIMKYVM